MDPDDLPEPSEPDVDHPEPPAEPEQNEEPLVPEPEEEASAPTRRGSMDEADSVTIDGVNIPVPDSEDGFFGDTVCFQTDYCQDYFWEIDVTPSSFADELFGTPDALVLAAVNDRKKRTEVRLKELSQEDQKRFAVAKHKELTAWLKHKT